MSDIDFVPKFLTVSCTSGAVKVTYSIKLKTDTFDDEISGGEVDLSSEKITEAVNSLSEAVLEHLRESVGLSITKVEAPLWHQTATPEDEEDPL